MANRLRVVLAQLNLMVGDIPGNTAKVLDAARQAMAMHAADVIVFPELALTGYPPEDLLLRPSLQRRIETALQALCDARLPIAMVVGFPWHDHGRLLNAAAVIDGGEITLRYAKQHLPNYQVFDEKRYFEAGESSGLVTLRGVPMAITICEDIWREAPAHDAARAGAQLILNLNASPFHDGKALQREQLLSRQSKSNRVAIVYVNQVGAQDELVFDGGSLVFDPTGECAVRVPPFVEGLFLAEFVCDGGCLPIHQRLPEPLSQEAAVYQALVLGVRDYVNKNGFKSVVLGLSGGIDSALTLAIAVDALGAERVRAVMMPFKYTADISKEDAEAEALTLGVQYDVLPIAPMYDQFIGALTPMFVGKAVDTTEENLQARIRGVLLMALSNKFGALVLTTGNKSEMAVGYSTLYGDMAGGFDVLKDVPKTLVFRLATYRNGVSFCIPQRVIDRPPSAELAPDQKDQDSLPPYEVLDRILQLYVEQDYSAEAIIFEDIAAPEVIRRVIRLVDINEYKRRQAPIGVRITERGFGKDRRYPITNGWKPGN